MGSIEILVAGECYRLDRGSRKWDGPSAEVLECVRTMAQFFRRNELEGHLPDPVFGEAQYVATKLGGEIDGSQIERPPFDSETATALRILY